MRNTNINMIFMHNKVWRKNICATFVEIKFDLAFYLTILSKYVPHFININLDTITKVYEMIKVLLKAVRIVPMARITLISM